jgi:hypothetical protein
VLPSIISSSPDMYLIPSSVLRPTDWDHALYWYEQAADDGGTEEDPPYQLQARIAEMLRLGGPNLKKDPLRSGMNGTLLLLLFFFYLFIFFIFFFLLFISV